MPRFICDRSSYAITHREYTDEGFLRVPGNVARAGNVQEYYAKELGITDRDPLSIVRVYRPAEEVFKPESLTSYQGADVTDNHPSQMVDANTYKDVSRGVTISGGRQEGDFVVCDLIIKDKDAIKAVESGKVQLSAGYTADYDASSGVTPDGESYDYIQRNIKINHVALVDMARAGHQARLFDNKGVGKMPIVTLDNGRTVTLDNEANAALISDAFDRMGGIIDTQKVLIDDQTSQIETLSKQTSDSAIAERVSAIVTTMDSARRLVGSTFDCAATDPVEIQRAALVALGRKNMTDKNASYVSGAFDAACEQKDADTEAMRKKLADMGMGEKEIEDMSPEEMSAALEKKKESNDSHRQLANDAAMKTNNAQTKDSVSPFAKMKADRANAWKGKE
jgi:hypothetical protein